MLIDSRICSAVLIHTNGRGLSFQGDEALDNRPRAYIDAGISAMPRKEWPWTRIRAHMPMAMSVAVISTPGVDAGGQEARRACVEGRRTAMPITIATTISR